MQRRIPFALAGLFLIALVAGCNKEQPQQIIIQMPPKEEPQEKKVDETPSNDTPNLGTKFDLPAPSLTPQEKYDAAVSTAFRHLADRKADLALNAFQEAQAAVDTDFVKGEIARLKAVLDRQTAADRTASDIQSVLDAGRPDEAAKLASQALEQFGDSDYAEKFANLKRQADALLSTQLQEAEKKKQFLDEAEAARKANNLRGALVAFDQAAANGAEVTTLKPAYDEIRDKVTRYDEQRAKAAELRRDPDTMDEALVALEEAAKMWPTPQITQEIDDTKVALNNRRDRLAVADFEVIGDVGIPLAGRTIAEELLPRFKGRFDLVERTQVEAIVKELKLDDDDLQTNDTSRAQLGKLAKARYMVVGSVSRLFGLVVNARLVDVQSGLIVQTAKIVVTDPKDLTAKLPDLAQMLQMSDEQKIAYEQELAKQAVVMPPPPQAQAQLPPPPPPPEPQAAPVQPIVVFTPAPPAIGQVVVADFDGIPQPVAQPQAVVIVQDNPWQRNAFFVAIELGDNAFRRGRFREAMRQFEFALAIAPGDPNIQIRIDRCRPFLPPPVVILPRPRLAVLPFVELGRFGFVPPGFGTWTADNIAPYFFPAYDIVDRGEVYWWMGRLGLTYRDVLVNPSARLLLARALGVRYFLMGNLRETFSFDATTHLVDAEFNALVGSGRIHVRTPFELKVRLRELAQLTLLPPQQQVVFVEQTVVVERQIQQAQVHIGNGKFSLAINIYKEVLVTRPDSIQARHALIEAERQQRFYEMQEARRIAYEREQARIRFEQQRQLELAAAAEAARLDAERRAFARAEADRAALARQQEQAQVQLLFQARNAAKNRQFAISINFFQSAAAINRSPQVMNELAAVRAQQAEAERVRLAQEAAAREAALQQQREQQAQAGRAALLAEQQQRKNAEAERRKNQETQNKAAYDSLLNQAQAAKAKGDHAAAVSALQTARTLRPSPEIEQLVSGALVDQAKAEADKKGSAERAKLEKQLAAEQERRRQAELEAAKNKAKYEEAIKLARAALKERKYNDARQQFQLASAVQRTDEAIIGLRQVDDEIAKEKAAADAARKAQEDAQKKDSEVARLIAEAKTATAAKNFNLARQNLQAAIKLKPGSVEAQAELQTVQQAQADHQAAIRKQKEDQDKLANFKKLFNAGKTNLAAKQYDAAISSFNQALALNPTDATAQAALKDAQQQQANAVKDSAALEAARKKREAYEGFIQQGNTAMKLNNVDAAIAAFKSAQQTLPGDAASAQLLKDAETKKAEAVAADAARLKTANFNAAIARARSAIKTGKFDDAVIGIADAGKIDPSHAELKKVQQELSDARNAVANAQKMKEAEIQRQKFQAHITAARQAIAAKNFDAAEKALADARAMSANDPLIAAVQKEIADGKNAIADNTKRQMEYANAIKAAQAALAASKFDEAIRSAQEALRISPKDATANQIVAQAEKAKSDAANATTEAAKRKLAYDNAIKSAQTALAAGKFDEAIRDAQEALKITPKDPVANQVIVQAEKAKADAANANNEAAKRKLAYDNAIKVAQASLNGGKFDDAIQYATEALKVAPKDAVANQIIAQAQKAKADAASANNEAAKRKLAYDNAIKAAQTALTGGKFDEAIQNAQAALNLVPKDSAANQIIAQAQKAKADAANANNEAAKRKLAYDNAIKAAQTALTGGKFDEAIQQANAALAIMPKDSVANQIVAQAQKAKQDAANADNEAAKRKLAYDNAIKAAQAALAGGKFDEAIQQANAALAIMPKDSVANQIVAQAQKAKQDAANANNEAAKRKLAYDNAIKAAQAALAGGKFDEAIQQAQAALTIAPKDPTANQIIAQAQKSKQDAANAANEAAKRKAAYDNAIKSASAALTAGKFDEAIQNAQAALAIVPKDSVANQIIAQAQKGKQDAANAANEAGKRKAAYDNAIKAAQAALAGGKFDEAIQQAQGALAIAPKDPTANQIIAQAQKSKQDAANAAAITNAYNQNIIAARGAFAQKNYQGAIQLATEALKYKPNDGEATKIINESRTALTPPKKDPPKIEIPKKDPPKTEPAKVDPNKAAYDQQINAARNAMNQKNYPAAVNSATEALRLKPNDPDATKILTDARNLLPKKK